MKTYLITGGAGFLGAALTKKLIKNKNKVVVIDNLSNGYKSNIDKKAIFYKGDCHNIRFINKLSKYKFDAIFHLAGQSSAEMSFENPLYDMQSNSLSTLILLNFAKKINCQKFIYASSMSVYGSVKSNPVNEYTNLNPISFYGANKIASENYLKIFSNFFIKTIALRFFNIYGPGQNLKNLKQGMVSIYFAQALKNKQIIVKGSGRRFRDFIHIDDAVNACIKTLSYNAKGYSCFNIGSGKKNTINKLLKIIIKNFNKKILIIFKGKTPGDQHGIFSNSSKASRKLNWKAKINLEQGIRKYYKNLINNYQKK